MQCAKCKAAALKSNELNVKSEAQKCKKRGREWEREIMRDREDTGAYTGGGAVPPPPPKKKKKKERERKKKGRGHRKKKRIKSRERYNKSSSFSNN